jgi:hypothetical protein
VWINRLELSKSIFLRRYMTGYTDDAMENHGLRGQTRRVLQKPFTHEMLASRVRDALDATRRS